MSNSQTDQLAMYRVSLKAIIRNNKNEVLVVREKNNTNWNLPGGSMDYGESEQQALARELHEEVGYTGDFAMKYVGVQPMFLPTKQVYRLWIVYEVTPDNDDFTVGAEAHEIDFIDPTIFCDSQARSERLVYKFCVDLSFPAVI